MPRESKYAQVFSFFLSAWFMVVKSHLCSPCRTGAFALYLFLWTWHLAVLFFPFIFHQTSILPMRSCTSPRQIAFLSKRRRGRMQAWSLVFNGTSFNWHQKTLINALFILVAAIKLLWYAVFDHLGLKFIAHSEDWPHVFLMF